MQLPDLLARCESYPERVFATVAHIVYPELRPQFRINGYRADFALPDLGLLIEIDGRTHHSTPEQIAHDRLRDERLVGCGWRILRFDAQAVIDDATSCVAEVTATPEPLPFDEG